MLFYACNHQNMTTMLDLWVLGNPTIHFKVVASQPVRNCKRRDCNTVPDHISTTPRLEVIQPQQVVKVKHDLIITHGMPSWSNGINPALPGFIIRVPSGEQTSAEGRDNGPFIALWAIIPLVATNWVATVLVAVTIGHYRE